MRVRRATKFKDQLVEALITLTNALRSGFSLQRAFQLIAHDMRSRSARSSDASSRSCAFGIDTEQGLRNMHKRLPSEDLDLVVTSIAISQSVGGNLAEVFDKIGETIRERRRVEGRIDSLTAQGKIQGSSSRSAARPWGWRSTGSTRRHGSPLNNVAGYIIIGFMIIMEGLVLLHPQDREHRGLAEWKPSS